MAQSSALFALLEAENEPTQKSYNEIVDEVIRNPKLISHLIDDSVRDDVLILLTSHSHRLGYFFRRVRSVALRNPKSMAFSNIATETVNLFVDTIPHLHQLLESDKVLEFLVPGLDVCITPSQCPVLREVASVLGSSGTLLEHLVSDHLGVEIVRQWASMQSKDALDAGTLNLWTEKLVSMVHNCAIDHGVTLEIQNWHVLKALKTSLQDIANSISMSSYKQSALATLHDLPALGSMTQLDREDKKGRSGRYQDTASTLPSLKDADKRSLKLFDLHVPGSKNSLLEIITRLEREKTTAILISVASKLPCYLCNSSLGTLSQASKRESNNESFQAVSSPHIEILDKGLGFWKVLLSPQALRSVLHLGTHGFDGSITEKLKEIASGRWNPQTQPRAGLRSQRKRLKVPVRKTKCGQNQFILWQVVVGMNAETEVPQQEIKVWEVCVYAEISKILDRVIFLHQGYSDETIHLCQQHSPAVDGVQFPLQFENSTSLPSSSNRPSADFDIRTVDQDIIGMTNKFYALTEPVIRSILSNDITAEFPFALSTEEERVVHHFRTASLVLGRSGTGKTTCLVFKLFGKYLASKAVADEKPIRQVLLTRSSFLADKLSTYTRNLVKTRLSKSLDLDLSPPSEHILSIVTEEDLQKSTIFALRDTSFPLICTWECFLRILENTAAKLDYRNLHDEAEPMEQRSDEVPHARSSANGQPIDFHAFRTDYWPHFPHGLTKDLSVNLVFAEIMGVIKGSASSRESLEPLHREEYLARSCRLAPTFVLEAERLRVYDVFKMYEKLKLELGGVDYIDRVVRLLRAVRQDSALNQLLRFTFDEVYIDEIQDQRCLDIELLLSFIKDGRGFHFAGDTAQAISQDSTFRFSEIKALFYEHFAAASAATHQAELSRPKMFTLSKNYRSHEGILALASLIMGMIWKGFPETIDKLDPEIGHLNGPKPVLFRGVDCEILRSRDCGHTTLSAGTADFGAEQVILVRDTHMKNSLQAEIGDVALVLTILESKGMEFDDVILWNFFTECPDQAGVRSLEKLEKEPALFDPRRHANMCSELKSLYVAITRARVQLFIMESSETTATTVLRFLGNDTSGSLIHVTSPCHEDFAMRLETLRPATSLDPRQWSQRGAIFMHRGMYRDAIKSYRKAEDVCGETTAEGYLHENEGKNLILALECFRKVNLINDAARVLVALGKPEDAAEILSKAKKYSKAASLFAEAGLIMKAVDCHHRAGEHSEVAAILNKERNYDRLVSYLDENRENIPNSILQGYGLLCKLLLKQNKISIEHRKYAIRLLGSSAEQERCFLEYGLDDDLVQLYGNQLRYEDLFHLYSKNGQLEQALNLAITQDLLQRLEPEVISLLDYVWVSYIGEQRSSTPFKLPTGFITPNVSLRAEQWQASELIYSMKDSIARKHVAGMESSVPKTILCLRKILNATAITRATNLDDLPLEMMQEAIICARNLKIHKDIDALKTLLLLAGLWKSRHGKDVFTVLPWSPLREILANVSDSEVTKVVTQRVLDHLVSSILALDAKARELWRVKWPSRCVQFVTLGFCPRKRVGEECFWLHRPVSAEDCARLLDDIVRMSNIFCGAAVLYYHRSLNGIFQEKYLSIKRYWLERLLRELTQLSSVEQHSAAVVRSQAELSHDMSFAAVSSFLEELLYYRLKSEWEQRSNFTSLLEHLQLAQAFGSNVRNRHFRALSHRLLNNERYNLQRHLSLMISLKENVGHWSASLFQESLATFLQDLDKIAVPALSTLHSLTAVFEYFATHLVLKTCAAACVIPTSWIDLHVTLTNKIKKSPEPLREDDKYRYQGCLIQLAKSFCHTLSRLDKAALPNDFLLCSGKTHPSLLLRQRNAELVAILIANLAATSPEPPIGFNEIWAKAKEIFEYDFIKALHLISRTPDELTRRLLASIERYNGKNALVVVIKDRKKGHAFSNLERQPGVKSLPFDQLCPLTPTSAAASEPADQDALPTSVDGVHGTYEQYSTAEIEAMIKIQRLWRSISLRVKSRRSYESVPECRVTARLFNLGAQHPAPVNNKDRKAVRKLLLLHGVALSLRLDTAKGLLSKLQRDAMTCIENVEISQGVDESVDDILCRGRDVETLLVKAERKMTDEHLVELVKNGVLSMLEKETKDVETLIVEAERILSETTKMVDTMSRKST